MSDKQADSFKGSVYMGRKLALGIEIAFLIVGPLLLLFGIYRTTKAVRKVFNYFLAKELHVGVVVDSVGAATQPMLEYHSINESGDHGQGDDEQKKF